MICGDLKNHKGLIIQGNVREVTNECVIIMREIYKKHLQIYGSEMSMGMLMEMLIRAIDEETKEEGVEWRISKEQKLAYTE